VESAAAEAERWLGDEGGKDYSNLKQGPPLYFKQNQNMVQNNIYFLDRY
jgi:hypothetical protein